MVKLSVVLMSYNRKELLEKTFFTIKNSSYPFTLNIVDGGSNDIGTREFVNKHNGFISPSRISVGASMNKAIEILTPLEPDIVLISADDYLFQSYWAERLIEFWQSAHESIKLACCNLELDYDWNKVYAAWEYNLQYAFLRQSLPGSNWSFRWKDKDLIFPVANKTGGEDLEVCQKLRANNYHLAALDLTEHIGETRSAWGNQSYKYGKPFTRMQAMKQLGLI